MPNRVSAKNTRTEVDGLEPPITRIKILRLTVWQYPYLIMRMATHFQFHPEYS